MGLNGLKLKNQQHYTLFLQAVGENPFPARFSFEETQAPVAGRLRSLFSFGISTETHFQILKSIRFLALKFSPSVFKFQGFSYFILSCLLCHFMSFLCLFLLLRILTITFCLLNLEKYPYFKDQSSFWHVN